MPSPPLENTYGETTSGMTCHHNPWTAHTVRRHRRDMPSYHLDGTHGLTTSGVTPQTDRRRQACHAIIAFGQHTQSDGVGRVMPFPPLDNTYGGTTSGVTCHHSPWTAHTVRRRRPWQDIMALGQHTRSDVVRLGMPS
uniref:Uncharacterized protein n=1 Tax=Solanum lycopersicum TaxID=4081 RepID=A0A3Q7EZT5_SOLLC